MKLLLKAKKMPIGTVSKGRKKIAEGKWIDIKKERAMRLSDISLDDIKKLKTDKSYRDQFIMANQGLIKHIINKMWSRIKDVTESKQEANIGVLKAINKFDLKKNPTGKGFASYVGSYIKYSISNAIKAESDKTAKNSSLDINSSNEGRPLEETIEDPREKESEEKKEKQLKLKQNLEILRGKIKKEKARKVLDLMIEQYSKVAIAKMLKMTPASVTLIVQRDIHPIATKMLNKSMSIGWQEFINFLEEF